MRTAARQPRDVGLDVVERIRREMLVDEPWTSREARGFTWWGSWVRQRVWSAEPRRQAGDPVCHVRAHTPLFKDIEDDLATYRLVSDLNGLQPTSAAVYDPDARTISLRCGAFVDGDARGWLPMLLLGATAIQASMTWIAGTSEPAAAYELDTIPHPVAGIRPDPDDMLNLCVGEMPGAPLPFGPDVLRATAEQIGTVGLKAFEADGALVAVLRGDADHEALWQIRPLDHPMLGSGLLVSLVPLGHVGRDAGAWIANALNAAEDADWTGDERPVGLGAWKVEQGSLRHDAWFPSVMFADLDAADAPDIAMTMLSWGVLRARFAAARLPWLLAAGSSRFPDSEDGADTVQADEDDESSLPVAERGFGPGARERRPAAPAPDGRPVATLVVDPTDTSAFAEIDDAVAAAEDGDHIVVRAGIYRRPVVLDRAVSIVGEGDRESIVLEPIGGECLGFAAPGASVAGLTVRPARDGNEGALWSAVAVHDVDALIEGCTLSTHLGATVWVAGPSSFATLRDCLIADGAQNGLWVTEEGSASLEGCDVTRHSWPAIAADAFSRLFLEDCNVHDNLQVGIWVEDGALLNAARCRVTSNARAGIVLEHPAPKPRYDGELVANCAVASCLVEGNGDAGIVLRECSLPFVQDSQIRGHDVGILVMQGSGQVLSGNVLSGNDIGISVLGPGASPIAHDNRIDGGTTGILMQDGATGTYGRNHIEGCASAGVHVAGPGTAPEFASSVVVGCQVGITIEDGGSGSFQQNDLRGNASGSWSLDPTASPVRRGNQQDRGRGRARGTGLRLLN